jgi:hypothetical protein
MLVARFALVVLLAGSQAARAATFDEATGRLSLAGAAVAVGFDGAEPLPAALKPTFTDMNGSPLGDAAVAALLFEDPEGLEGGGYLRMGGDVQTLTFDLGDLAAAFVGRRIEVRFWQRPEGTGLTARLSWSIPMSGADPWPLLRVKFQPTGRVTDDGWEEWTSGPLDFAALGRFPPATLELKDEQLNSEWEQVTPDLALRVRLDALEILDLGQAAVRDAACTATAEAEACGDRGVCVFGRCADAALRYGQMPIDPGLRTDYLARLLFEFRTFEGGRLAQAQMGQLAVSAGAASVETSATRFWRRIEEGVGALGDAHASPPAASSGPAAAIGNFGVCVHLGEADLLPAGGRAPLVFSIDGTGPVAAALAVGDVLTAIDGQPPQDWARAVGLRARMAGDSRAFDLVLTPWLLRAAMVGGSVATFSRCPHGGPNPARCTAAEVETIEIDFGALAAATLLAGEPAAWLNEDQTCDYRFGRNVSAPDVREYSFAGWSDDGEVRTLLINGVPDPSWASGWLPKVRTALDPPPAYLIVDQRYGGGGSVSTVDYMMGMLVTDAEFDRMEILPIFDEPLDDQLLADLRRCSQRYGSCAGYFPWVLHEMSNLSPMKRGVAAGTKVAVLNGMDVSGNDFTTRLFQYRTAPTRIFGGVSMGGFGPIVDLPPSPFDGFGGSMQLWDTVFLQHPGDPLTGFTSGTGVTPDVDLLERQSDAVQGIDTVLVAARAWLLES